MKLLLKCIASVLSVALASTAISIESPSTILETASDQMIVRLKANQAVLKQQPEMVDGFVRELFLPHVDINAMVRLIIGKSAWRNASSADQADFTQQFREMVIDTYANALANYQGQHIRYLPLKTDYETQKFLQVPSVLVQSGGPDIRLNFHVVRRDTTWKVYDFSVDGISMIQSYRSQFQDTLRQGGLKAVLTQLSEA